MLFLIAFSTESKVEESAEFHASKVPSLETRSINGTLPELYNLENCLDLSLKVGISSWKSDLNATTSSVDAFPVTTATTDKLSPWYLSRYILILENAFWQ